jgi:hypothetical protein
MNIFLKQFKLVRDLLSTVFFVLLRLSVQRNSQYFYGRYMGTDNKLVLFIKNLIRPKRILKKFIYRQIFPIPYAFSAANKAEELPDLTNEYQRYLEILKRDGIVIVPGFFKKRSEALNKNYKLNTKEFPPRDKYYRFTADFNNLDIFNIATDPMILTILSKYYGCQPYYRHQPFINCTHLGTEKELLAPGFNDFWHYDTVNQMSAHILLKDVLDSDSCMFYAKASHRTHREYISKNDYYYSEEYINDNFEIVPCIGESGSLVIFDPNGLHRVDLKTKKFRAHLHLNFVPGNDVADSSTAAFEFNSKDTQFSFSDDTRSQLLKLKHYQAASLSHIFPLQHYVDKE